MAVRAIVFLTLFLLVLFTESKLWVGAPAILTGIGKTLCGIYPVSYYMPFSDADVPAYTLFADYEKIYIFYILLAVSIVLSILHLLSWLLSKKHIGWMICGLTLCVIELLLSFSEVVLFSDTSYSNDPNLSNIVLSVFWLFLIGKAIYSYKKIQTHLEINKPETDKISE